METPLRAAVVGAGVAGVAVAHALRGVGFEVELFERDEQARSSGYQLNVMANGLYALSKLELLEPLRASGCGATLRRAPVVDALTGRVVFELRTVFGAQGELTSVSLYRGDLHRVLLESLRGPAPRCGAELASFTEEPGSGKVAVSFADGRTERFDLLVGADGAHSRVRRQLFPDHPPFTPRQAALLFAAHIDLCGTSEAERLFARQAREGEFALFIAPGTALILSHAGDGRFAVLIAVPDLALAHDVTTPERAKQLARDLLRDLRDPRVGHAIDVGFWEEGNPLVWENGDIEPLASFGRGAVVLCGDAAHPMIPVVAQGANQSFEDAWRLAEQLRDVARSGDAAGIPAAIARFSRERAPHVAHIQREARRRILPLAFRSRLAHRVYSQLLRFMPRRSFDRFDEHLLAYAIADPDCSIERIR
jgi:salicylate hydroxylase